MRNMDLSNLSDEELKANLLTLDYKGREYKEACLQELINRAVDKAVLEVSN